MIKAAAVLINFPSPSGFLGTSDTGKLNFGVSSAFTFPTGGAVVWLSTVAIVLAPSRVLARYIRELELEIERGP